MGEQKKELGSVRNRQIQHEAKIAADELVKAATDAERVRGTVADDVKDIIPHHPDEEEMTKEHPKVFISYSYDSDEHVKWVEDVATRLRTDSVDIILDRWHFHLGKPSGMEMNKAIADSDRVLCVCTDEYIRRVDEGKGGAGYEGCLITAELVKDASTDKFIPVVRNIKGTREAPTCLDRRGRVNLSDGPTYEAEYERLLRNLLNAVEIPLLGKNPFAKGTPSAKTKLNEPSDTDAEGNDLNHATLLDHKPTWTTQLTSLDQETTENRVAYALSQSEKGVHLVKDTVSNILTEAKQVIEELNLTSIELRISHNSDADLEIRGPEGRALRFYFINRANNSLDGSRLFAEIIRLEGLRQDQPFERTEEFEFTPVIDSNGGVSWKCKEGDSRKQMDNSEVLSFIFDRFIDILRTDKNARRQKGFLW